MQFIDNVKLKYKYAIIGIVAVVAAALPTALVVKGNVVTWNTIQAEVSGMAAAGDTLQVLQLSQQKRGLAAGLLNGKEEVRSAYDAKHAELDAALTRLAASASSLDSAIVSEVQRVQRDSADLARTVSTRGIDGTESFKRHTAVVFAALEILDDILGSSGIALDPVADSYYLGQATLVSLPHLSEMLAQARGHGMAILSRGQASAAEIQVIRTSAALANLRMSDASGSLKNAQHHNAAHKEVLADALAKAVSATSNVSKILDERVLASSKPIASAADFYRDTTQEIDAVFALTNASFKALNGEYVSQANDHRRRMLLQATILLSLLAAMAWLLYAFSKSATRALTQAVDAARTVADGDLSINIVATSRDEVGEVLQAMDDMTVRLRAVVQKVREGSESVATASAEIAQGNQDLSQRTEQQASALEQTAASMEELGSTVRQNADNARQANQLAASASEVAVRGGAVVGQVVETMKGINDSSKKIADIISVIDSIAFQTNILALNAAVEAARAGEQGRGFAVVASEVRNLAGRSADAAKEIKALITTSVERVEQGSALVDQAGSTMTEVVNSIKRVTDIMGEISAASSEQSNGVAQVGQAVSEMDQATQQNAALVEESAAAAESLKTQAQQLVSAVASFKLDADSAAQPANASWNGTAERRGPGRATNVTRPKFSAKKSPQKAADAPASSSSHASVDAAKTGSDDWTSF